MSHPTINAPSHQLRRSVIGVRHVGHLAEWLAASHCAQQPAWNVWPHRSVVTLDSSSPSTGLRSSRQIGQLSFEKTRVGLGAASNAWRSDAVSCRLRAVLTASRVSLSTRSSSARNLRCNAAASAAEFPKSFKANEKKI